MGDQPAHHRRSVQLKGYDYTLPGAYFITICTRPRDHVFGQVIDGQMQLNAWGRIAAEKWARTGESRPYLQLDAFVVMPNHVHAIIMILDSGRQEAGARRAAPLPGGVTRNNVAPCSLGAVVRAFKSAVTRRINLARHNANLYLAIQLL